MASHENAIRDYEAELEEMARVVDEYHTKCEKQKIRIQNLEENLKTEREEIAIAYEQRKNLAATKQEFDRKLATQMEQCRRQLSTIEHLKTIYQKVRKESLVYQKDLDKTKKDHLDMARRLMYSEDRLKEANEHRE